jgi:Major Facilitator Superfamily
MRASCVRPQYDLARDRGAATLALLSFAMLIVSLDQYIVIVALPDIGRELGYSSQTLQSVISAYAVASSGFLLFGGRAADLLGRRRRLVTGLAACAGDRPSSRHDRRLRGDPYPHRDRAGARLGTVAPRLPGAHGLGAASFVAAVDDDLAGFVHVGAEIRHVVEEHCVREHQPVGLMIDSRPLTEEPNQWT